MRLEDHFKDALQKAVANEPPVVDAWDRLQGRIRRDRVLRLAVSLVGVAAVVAAAAIVVPRLGSKSSVEPIVPPTSESTKPTVVWQTYRDEVARYIVSYPPEWTRSSFEGVVEIQPPGVPPLPKGDPTFAVTIMLRLGKVEVEGNAEDPYPTVRPDGVVVETHSDASGSRSTVYQYPWTGVCDASSPACPRGEATLVVRVMAGTDDYWTLYHEIGEEIARSIRQSQS